MQSITIQIPDTMATNLTRYTRQHQDCPAQIGSTVEELATYLLSIADTAYSRPGSWEASAMEMAGILGSGFAAEQAEEEEEGEDRPNAWEIQCDRLYSLLSGHYTVKVSAYARGQRCGRELDHRRTQQHLAARIPDCLADWVPCSTWLQSTKHKIGGWHRRSTPGAFAAMPRRYNRNSTATRKRMAFLWQSPFYKSNRI